MTDTPPTPPTPATPSAAPAGAYQPAPAGPKQTQSLVGFLLGIGSIVFAGLGIIGIGLGVAAIIVSNKAKKSEPGPADGAANSDEVGVSGSDNGEDEK